MIVNGELKNAQLENLSSDPTAYDGKVYFNTASGTAKIHDGAEWDELVEASESQVLTNKDIDGGTASNTSRLTVPKAAKSTLDGLTRKEGTLLYATDLDK